MFIFTISNVFTLTKSSTFANLLIQKPGFVCYYKNERKKSGGKSSFKGTLMQIWKSAKIFVFIWKWYVEDFTLKHLLLFEICAREICEKFIYKHSETIEKLENVKNVKN